MSIGGHGWSDLYLPGRLGYSPAEAGIRGSQGGTGPAMFLGACPNSVKRFRLGRPDLLRVRPAGGAMCTSARPTLGKGWLPQREGHEGGGAQLVKHLVKLEAGTAQS